jgi:hypothetical protein
MAQLLKRDPFMTIKTLMIATLFIILSGCSISYSESITTHRNFLVVAVYDTKPMSVDLLDMTNFNMYYNYPIKPECKDWFKEGSYVLMNETVVSFSGMESKSLAMSEAIENLCFK